MISLNTFGRLSRRLGSWSLEEDASLLRLYRYLNTTVKLGNWLVICMDELDDLEMESEMGSDHSGGPEATARSTTGHAVGLASKNSWSLIHWSSKLQGATARSTPDAETTAVSGCTLEAIAPLLHLFGQITGKELL